MCVKGCGIYDFFLIPCLVLYIPSPALYIPFPQLHLLLPAVNNPLPVNKDTPNKSS